MLKPDLLLAPPFLPQDYEEAIKPYAGMGQVREAFAGPSGVTLMGSLAGLRRSSEYATQQSRFMQEKASHLPGEITSAEDLNTILQHNAADAVLRHNGLGEMTRLMVGVTSEAVGDEPEVAKRGRELGELSIEARAQYAASTILRASDVLYGCWDEAGHSVSVWDRSLAVGARYNTLHNPVIAGSTWKRYLELKDQAIEAVVSNPEKQPSKGGRSRIAAVINEARFALKAKRKIENVIGTRAGSLDMIEIMYARAIMCTPEPIQLDPADVRLSLAVANKIRITMNNAASVDRTVAEASPARYFAYLLNVLEPACAVNVEKEIFHRAIEKVTRQRATT